MTGRNSSSAPHASEATTFEASREEESTGPFQDATREQSDLRFIRRFQPKAPARPCSALSAPENFIADTLLKRLLDRVIGRRRWPLAAAALAITVIAAVPVGKSLRTARDAAEGDVVEAGGATIRYASLPKAAEPDEAPPQPETPTPSPAAAPKPLPPSVADLAADTPPKPAAPPSAFAIPAAAVTAFPPAAPPADATASDAPAPPPAPAKPARDPRKLDALVERGNQLLAAGEIAAARLFFERAAADEDPRGALGLARSYDEAVLKTLPVVGLGGNAAEAERWYRRAKELGAPGRTDMSAAQAAR